jgi:hypothetical protein
MATTGRGEVEEVDDSDLLAPVAFALEIDVVERSRPLVVLEAFDDDIGAALDRRRSPGRECLSRSRRKADGNSCHPALETRRAGKHESLAARKGGLGSVGHVRSSRCHRHSGHGRAIATLCVGIAELRQPQHVAHAPLRGAAVGVDEGVLRIEMRWVAWQARRFVDSEPALVQPVDVGVMRVEDGIQR